MVKILELNGRNLVNYAGEFAGSQERPRDLETQAAIKVLHVQAESSDPERFREEARTIAHLEHPHIVRVLEFGVENGFPFLVMTFAPSGTLRQRHPKGEQLPLMTIISYIEQIA